MWIVFVVIAAFFAVSAWSRSKTTGSRTRRHNGGGDSGFYYGAGIHGAAQHQGVIPDDGAGQNGSDSSGDSGSHWGGSDGCSNDHGGSFDGGGGDCGDGGGGGD